MTAEETDAIDEMEAADAEQAESEAKPAQEEGVGDGAPKTSEMRMQANHPHLRAYTKEEASYYGKKGAMVAAEGRKRRRSMAEAFRVALTSPIAKTHPRYNEIKRMLRAHGLLTEGHEPTNQDMIILGMMQQARNNPAAAAFVRDTIGERPIEFKDVSVNAPPVILGVHDQAFIDKERKRLEKELAEVVDVVEAVTVKQKLVEGAPPPPSPPPPPASPENKPAPASAQTPPVKPPVSAPKPPAANTRPSPAKPPAPPKLPVLHQSGNMAVLPVAFPRRG